MAAIFIISCSGKNVKNHNDVPGAHQSPHLFSNQCGAKILNFL
jgi:hypothetical protein